MAPSPNGVYLVFINYTTLLCVRKKRTNIFKNANKIISLINKQNSEDILLLDEY